MCANIDQRRTFIFNNFNTFLTLLYFFHKSPNIHKTRGKNFTQIFKSFSFINIPILNIRKTINYSPTTCR